MAALLALGAAATWGVADFLGGLTSRRADEFAVATLSQAAGLVVLAALLPLGSAGASAPALWWGALAGLGGAGGLVAYFRALAIGPMGVTAPVAALSGAAVPVIAGFALGERPGAVALLGVVVGLAATVLASRPAEQAVVHAGDHPPSPSTPAGTSATAENPDAGDVGDAGATSLRRGVLTALVAGLLFGLFFIALDRAPTDAGLWPLLGARASGLSMLALLLVRRRPAPPPTRATWVALGSGLLDMAANALFLLAVQRGLLILVSVLTSLYPVGVVLLARVVLGERLARWQQLGVVLALVAVVLIAL